MRGGDRPPVALALKTEGSSNETPTKKSVTFDLGKSPASPISRKTHRKSALKKKPASHDASSLLKQRPYLSKIAQSPPTAVSEPSPTPDSTQPPPTKTTHERTISWGKKLGSLDDGVMDKLAQRAQ